MLTLRLQYVSTPSLFLALAVLLTSPRSCLGRERSASRPAFQEGNLSRTDYLTRGVRHQDFQSIVDHVPQSKVLPHAREPQLQHRQEHREEDRQFQLGAVRLDHLHGCSSGVCRALLLSGCEKGLRINNTSETGRKESGFVRERDAQVGYEILILRMYTMAWTPIGRLATVMNPCNTTERNGTKRQWPWMDTTGHM